MIRFIKEHREICGVEPICRVLQIAPSTFYAHFTVERDPDLASDRAKRDAELRPEVKRVWEENLEVYGARKLWHAMKREKFGIARCTVERLMRDIGIKGVRRSKKVKTTWPDKALASPLDRVNRQFRATMPNQLWVSDFTYVSTWQGFVYVAFVIDTFANKIVGWRASKSQQTQFVLDALEQALYERRLPIALSITVIAAANTCRSNTQNGWRMPGWNPALAPSAVRMTMHSPRQ